MYHVVSPFPLISLLPSISLNMTPLPTIASPKLSLLLLAILSSLASSCVAFQSSTPTAPYRVQLLQAKSGNSDTTSTTTKSPPRKKKNPMSDSILFGKPQYNWVTGKTEAKMTSSYIHNWNTRRSKADGATIPPVADAKKESGDDKKKPWWQF